MSLDKATIRRVATLARIELPEAELDTTAQQLSGIFNWIEQLREVNTDNVAPMSGGTDLKLPWRPDVVTDGGMTDKVLANAPESKDGFFAVPKVVE
jgi:aspartyl-tRNA(Asn)/glutamyl-tRNA(Gln) amidotransferase subunit C